MSKRDEDLRSLAEEATAVTVETIDLARQVRQLEQYGGHVDPSLRALVASVNQRAASALGKVTDRQIARQQGAAEDALVASMEYLDSKKFAQRVRRRRALSDMKKRLAETRERMVTPAVPSVRPLVASISDDFIDNPPPASFKNGAPIPLAPEGELRRRTKAEAAKLRSQCKECNFVSTKMAVGLHQVKTGHKGVVSLPPVILNKTKVKPWLSKPGEDTQTIR